MIQCERNALQKMLKSQLKFKLGDVVTIKNELHTIISIDPDPYDNNTRIILCSKSDDDKLVAEFTEFYEKKAEKLENMDFKLKVERDENNKIIVKIQPKN
jgi:hypothetical protein